MSDDDQHHHARRESRRQSTGTWAIGAIAALLLVSWAAPFHLDPPVPSRVSWLLVLVDSMSFPIGLVVAALTVGAIRRRRVPWSIVGGAVVALVVVLPMTNGVRSSETAPPTPEPGVLRVISANLLVWNRDIGAAATQLREHEPDVLLLQEWGDRHRARVPEVLGGRWTLVASAPRSDATGVAAFVRTKYVEQVDADIWTFRRSGHPAVRVRWRGRDGTTTFYGVHLPPPITARMADEAAADAAELRARIRRTSGAVVLGGDLNATTGSAIDRALRGAGLTEAWDARGRGRGTTWSVRGVLRWFPGIRVDHVYASPGLHLLAVDRLDGAGSDHRPVVVDLRVREFRN